MPARPTLLRALALVAALALGHALTPAARLGDGPERIIAALRDRSSTVEAP